MYKRMTSRDHPVDPDVEDNSALLQDSLDAEATNPSWRLSFPHVLVGTIVSFSFGYHLGVVNEPLESISLDLGFSGNTLAEGLVVSTCLGGAFIGYLFSGWIDDGFGMGFSVVCFAYDGAFISAATKTLMGMLLGRLLVGTGMGLRPPVAAAYVTEISPAFIRGTYGSFFQIATCLGLMGALFIGLPRASMFRWRICFFVSAVPAGILALAMVFCAESPHWPYKQGRIVEVEAEFEKVLGGRHVKLAVQELSKLDRGDGLDTVKSRDLLQSRHFRGSVIAMFLMDKLGRKVLLLWSFLGMDVSMCLQAAAATSYISSPGALYLSVGGMPMCVFTFALGAGPVLGLLLPEIFSNQIRAKAKAICMSIRWVKNFFVGLLFLRLLEQLGAKLLYTMFAMVCFAAVVYLKNNVMETRKISPRN